MPVLPTYTAQIGGAAVNGGRRASTEEFAPAAGYSPDLGPAAHVASKFATALLVDKEDQEARSALIGSSEVRAKYAQELDNAATSDTDLAALKQRMADDLAKVGDNFQTRKGAQALQLYSANNDLMFDEQANHIAVQRAAATAKLEGAKLLRNESALLMTNPYYLPVAEQNAEALAAMTSRASPEQKALIADGLKKELNMTAAISSARMDPEGTLKRLQNGEWDLTPENRIAAISRAEHEIRLGQEAAAHTRVLARQERADADLAARLKYDKMVFGGKSTDADIRRQVMDDPAVGPATLEHIESVMRQHTKDLIEAPARTNPATFNNLRERIALPFGDPRKVTDTNDVWNYYGKGLSEPHAAALERRILENKTESGQKWSSAESEFLRNVRPQLDKSTMLSIDAGGGERMLAFTNHLRDKVDEYRKSEPPQDPYSLLRPGSKDYIGNDIPLYQSGAQRSQANLAGQLDKALAPKEPAKRKSLSDIFGTKAK